MKIRTRFVLAGVVTSAIVILATSGIIIRQSASELKQNFDDNLTARFTSAAPLIAATPDRRRLSEILTANATDTGIRILRDGQEVRVGPQPSRAVAFREHRLQTIAANGQRWRVYGGTVPGTNSNASTTVQVQMFASTKLLNGHIRNIERRLIIVALISMVVATAISWLTGTYVTGPLRRLTLAVTSYKTAANKIPDRQGVPEVDAVGRTVNDLLGSLRSEHEQTKVTLQTARDFSWNAVHELRTPLTALRADLDTLLIQSRASGSHDADVIVGLVRQQERMSSTLGALHDLARGDLFDAASFATVDLSEVVEDVVSSLRTLFPTHDLRIEIPQNAWVSGWGEGLRIATRNLVLNALRHGRDPGVVSVSLSKSSESWSLVVDDDGPGVPRELRRTIFERFARGDSKAPGSGLGLALVAQQAALHNGSIQVEDSPLGGARFVLKVKSSVSAT